MKGLFTIISLLLFSTTFAATKYVTTTGAGNMDGNSWANAYTGSTLRTTINASTSGDEVWVAAGTYYTTTGTDRTISFNMKNGVTVYGSFAGTETLLSQRIFAGPTSILSAEIGAAGNSDNSYHTIHNTSLNNTAIIDGFVIRDANDNRAAGNDEGLGGGIFNNGTNSTTCSPTIRNCLITNNRAVFGAGIFNSGYLGNANPVISNCVITANHATDGGGGIDNFGLAGNANPTITNCIIYNNSAAGRAGAMYCWGGNNGSANPVVLNSVFVNNTAVDGGGIVCDNLNSSSGSSGAGNPVFRNCIFRGNTVTGLGPNFYIRGTATFTATYTAIDLTSQTTPHVASGVGTGNISNDPLFANIASAAGTDGFWMTSDDGLQLQSTSPCINTGDNTGVAGMDFLFTTRIVNTTVDMGAYEYNAPVTAIENRIANNKVVLYPNPAKSTIQISELKNTESSVSIINDLGIIVKELTLSNGEIDIDELPKGVYMVIVKNGTLNFIEKFVKE